MANDSYLPSAVYKFPPECPTCQLHGICECSQIPLNENERAWPVFSIYTNLAESDWSRMESTVTKIYGHRAGSTLGQMASAPTLLYAEDATFSYTMLGKEKRVQSYFIISRNNSNLMWPRRDRTHLGITWESFWNKTGNVDQSDPPDFQTKMKKKKDTAKSGLKIPKWTSTKTYTKTFTAHHMPVLYLYSTEFWYSQSGKR